MKMFIKKKHLPIAFPIAIMLAIGAITIFVGNIRLSNTLKERPTNIIVANTSTTKTNIYWKNTEATFSRLFYKKKESSAPYINVKGTSIYKDIKNNEYIYEVSINNLEPETEYTFYIQTPKKAWDDSSVFKTKKVTETISLPKTKNGTSEEGMFLLVQNPEESIMLYTQQYGDWALSLEGSDYTITEYGQYIPSMILTDRLKSSILKLRSPVYAESGANCKTNINRKDDQYDPKPAGVHDILVRLIGGCKGHHATECYDDVYCQSVEKGVNPALPITLWVHESAGSMYAKYGNVEDFGIHGGGVPARDFTRQLEHLLDVQMDEGYISGYCTDKGLTAEERWATKYAKGYCNDSNIVAGQQYISEIRKYYSWLKGSSFPSWPWRVSPNSNACDRSKEVTNQIYRDCEGNPIGTNPEPPKPEVYCWQINPDTNTCEKTKKKYKDCTGENLYISEEKCKEKIIDTTEICCLKDKQLSIVQSHSCTGSIMDDIPLDSCEIVPFEYHLTKGVNFVKAYEVFDNNLEGVNSAHGLIEYFQNKVITIASFNDGSWDQIVEYKDNKIYGTDFELKAGEIYLMISLEEASLSSFGYTLNQKEIDLAKIVGWNLIPTSILQAKAQKTHEIFENSLLDSIKQVAIWNKSFGMFEYTVKDKDNNILGKDMLITEQDSIFINVIN